MAIKVITVIYRFFPLPFQNGFHFSSFVLRSSVGKRLCVSMCLSSLSPVDGSSVCKLMRCDAHRSLEMVWQLCRQEMLVLGDSKRIILYNRIPEWLIMIFCEGITIFCVLFKDILFLMF